MLKVISGGQTGVDRAALDAALNFKVPCGGWCPQGRLAEDGIIAPHYPLTELAGAGFTERTRQNVIDSDGTVIIYFESLAGGTEQTLLFCLQHRKPYLLIDATALPVSCSAERITGFIDSHSIITLNIAGPRASEAAAAYVYTLDTMALVIELGRIR